MNDDQFTKLFKYMEDFRSEVRTELEKTANKDNLEQLIDTVDNFIG